MASSYRVMAVTCNRFPELVTLSCCEIDWTESCFDTEVAVMTPTATSTSVVAIPISLHNAPANRHPELNPALCFVQVIMIPS